jgi:hypothetical protein
MEKVTVTVDIQTFNTIIMGLDELPHKVSRPVIDELVQQAKSQIKSNEQSPQGPLGDKVIQ